MSGVEMEPNTPDVQSGVDRVSSEIKGLTPTLQSGTSKGFTGRLRRPRCQDRPGVRVRSTWSDSGPQSLEVRSLDNSEGRGYPEDGMGG